MSSRVAAVILATALVGCASVPPPALPTPKLIQASVVDLGTISADPVTTWQAGKYAVRAACYAYLNASATRSADLSLANTGIGMGGAAATGFLVSGGDPAGGAAAGGIAALAQSFLSAFQASGALPYSGATTTLVVGAMDAWDGYVEAHLPASVPEAAGDVLELWWQCSPGGYAQLILKSSVTAQITTAPASAVPAAVVVPAPSPPEPLLRRPRARKQARTPAAPTDSPSGALQRYLAGQGPLPGFDHPRVRINGL